MEALGVVSGVLNIFTVVDLLSQVLQGVRNERSITRQDVESLQLILQRVHSARVDIENALLNNAAAQENDGFTNTLRQAKEVAQELEIWLENDMSSKRNPTFHDRFKWAMLQPKRRDEMERIGTKLLLLEGGARLQLLRLNRPLIGQSSISHGLTPESQSVVTALVDQLQEDRKAAKSREEIIAIGRLLEDYVQPGQPQRTQQEIRDEARQIVLRDLQYEVMSHRAEAIKSATTTSCKWIWDEKLDNGHGSLADWLVSGTGVCFIAGNEGSGKSTLMKYLFHQSQTFELLSKWAALDSTPLATAAFFFWRNGTQLEKSEEGLLRSILHSVLSQQPRMIDSVLPGIYAKAYASISSRKPTDSDNGVGRWRVDVLREAFSRLIRQTQPPLKLFFLIDGIDEYQDDQSDEQTMIELLTKEITASKNAKAIIASRKLDDLEKLGIKPSLTVHDSNHNAIHSYVKETLDKELRGYVDRLPEDTSDRIASSASGSFLWASLTLANMSQLLEEGHSVDKIEEALRGMMLPSTVHQLYDQLWTAIPDLDKRRASEIVQIVLVGSGVLSQSAEEDIRLVDLMLALGHPDETIESKIIEWREPTIKRKCEDTAYSFMSIWPGFLTIEKGNDLDPAKLPSARIQYCHRSVPEYFLSDRSQQNLKTALGSQSFCPHLAHLKGAVQHLKILPMEVVQDAQSKHLLWNLVTRALLFSKQVGSISPAQPQDKINCHQLLQQLDLTMSHHQVQHRKKGSGNREITLQDPYSFFKFGDFGHQKKYLDSLSWVNLHPDHSHPRSDEDSFLSLCIRFGVKDYLLDSANLNKKTLKSKRGRPLLDYALHPSPIAPFDLVTREIVQTLLEHGANPNERFQIRSWGGKMAKATCWERALTWQHQTYKVEGAKHIVGTTDQARKIAEIRLQIMELLIDKGANARAEIMTSTGERLAVKAALQESFNGWVDEEKLRKVLALHETRSARHGIRRIFSR